MRLRVHDTLVVLFKFARLASAVLFKAATPIRTRFIKPPFNSSCSPARSLCALYSRRPSLKRQSINSTSTTDVDHWSMCTMSWKPAPATSAPHSYKIVNEKINGSEAAVFLRLVEHVPYTNANLNLNSHSGGFCVVLLLILWHYPFIKINPSTKLYHSLTFVKFNSPMFSTKNFPVRRSHSIW